MVETEMLRHTIIRVSILKGQIWRNKKSGELKEIFGVQGAVAHTRILGNLRGKPHKVRKKDLWIFYEKVG